MELSGAKLSTVQWGVNGCLSYIGLVCLDGGRRSLEGSEWLLHGRATLRAVRFGVRERQHAFLSSSPADFRGAEARLSGRVVRFTEPSETAAHNLYVINDDVTHAQIGRVFSYLNLAVTAFAVGGQYHHAERCTHPGYDGIYLFSIERTAGDVEASRLRFLVDGCHAGIVSIDILRH